MYNTHFVNSVIMNIRVISELLNNIIIIKVIFIHDISYYMTCRTIEKLNQ